MGIGNGKIVHGRKCVDVGWPVRPQGGQMSINTLTNAAMARRLDFVPFGSVPKNLSQIAAAAANAPRSREQAASAAAENGNAVNTALHVLFGYIPTEVLTLYVAVLAAIQKPGQVTKADWITFWVFLVATPVVVWLGPEHWLGSPKFWLMRR